MDQVNQKTSEYQFNGAALTQMRAGRSKAMIAKEIEVSRQLWDHYEKGGWPSVPILAKIMDRFNLTFDELVKPAPRVRQGKKHAASVAVVE